jgi:hypothetical protein
MLRASNYHSNDFLDNIAGAMIAANFLLANICVRIISLDSEISLHSSEYCNVWRGIVTQKKSYHGDKC